MRTHHIFGFFVIFVLVVSVPAALAQTGSITGTVKDSSGGVLPGAMITITNTGTNAQRSTPSDERGGYTVTLLPVGAYRIQAELSGFKTGLAENIMLNVDARLRIDFTLQVGGISEKVVVTGAAPLVQSETSSVGQVMDNQKITELPLNGRQFESLSQLVPGAVSPAPGSSLSARGGFNAGGARETQNDFTLDGINNNDAATNNFALRPIVDAIQEFKVLSNSYSAEFGRGGGAQVTVTTKSGTNSFHGAVWEFLRNDKLDAKDFFNTTGSKTPLRRNQFGGTIGGPIVHDKMFFFVAYEGMIRRQVYTSLQQVPSAAFRLGGFSALTTSLKNPFVSGTTFTGNQIPSGLINPVAQKMIALPAWPTPTPGLTGASNYLANLPYPDDVHNINGRIDYRISNSNTLFGRYGLTHDLLKSPCPSISQIPICVPGYGTTDTTTAHNFSLSDTHVFSNRFVNEVHAGFNRYQEPRLPFNANTNDLGTQLGIPTPGLPVLWGMPNFSVTGFSAIGDINSQPRVANTYQAGDSISYNKGMHAMRAGFDFRKIEFNATQGQRGAFTFTGTWTGNAFADFLLGLPATTSRDLTSDNLKYHRLDSFNLFFQDDWKVIERLTLNIGLRYEYNTPDVDK